MVWLMLTAGVVGLVLGRLTGGSLASFVNRKVRGVPLLVLGVVAYLAAGRAEQPEPWMLVGAGHVLLIGFALRNVRLVGVSVVIFGLSANLIPLLVNQGTPVTSSALIRADIATEERLRDEPWTVLIPAGDHLERRGDLLVVLGDSIPVPGLREVVSFGDLIVCAGLGNVLLRMTQPVRRRRLPELDAETIFFHTDVHTGKVVIGDELQWRAEDLGGGLGRPQIYEHAPRHGRSGAAGDPWAASDRDGDDVRRATDDGGAEAFDDLRSMSIASGSPAPASRAAPRAQVVDNRR